MTHPAIGETTEGRYPDAISSLVKAARDIARLERERDAALNHLQAVREFAHGLGAGTASRDQILDACTRMPFAPEHGEPGSEPTC